MNSLPAWRASVRGAIVKRLQGLGYSVTPMGNDVWTVRPADCDADMPMVRGVGALAAVLYAAEVLQKGQQ